MRAVTTLWLLLAIVVGFSPTARAACVPGNGIGLSRIVEIDTRNGPLYGHQTRYQRSESFLRPKEVVLTFDDGPLPWITRSILDTLDNHCTKATFFTVGRMAVSYPATLREVLARGHSLGTHTWSHPLNLKRLKQDAAIDEIERGFAAATLAAGQPVAPFFRFPGLNDNAPLLSYLQSRGVGIFTVDAISNDSFIGDERKLIAHTLAEVEARKGGIILFHDIKAATARALPVILAELKTRGYTVVQLKSVTSYEPRPQYTQQLAPLVAKALANAKQAPLPFYPAILRQSTDTVAEIPVETVSPEARAYVARADDNAKRGAVPKRVLASGASASPAPLKAVSGSGTRSARTVHHTKSGSSPTSSWFGTMTGGWVTTVSPPKLRRSAVD